MLAEQVILKMRICQYCFVLVCTLLSVNTYSNEKIVFATESATPAVLPKANGLMQANDKIIRTSPYQLLKEQTKNQWLWFDSSGISLAGLSLNKLLEDLGWLQPTPLKNLKASQFEIRDKQLTRGLLQLIEMADIYQNLSSESVLLQAINDAKTDELLESLIPNYDQVSHLRAAIAEYRNLSHYKWPKLDNKFRPRLGQSHKQVKGIRTILSLYGDLPAKAQTKTREDVFDSVVVKALKNFQQRHGLAADGKLGPKTYQALQVSPAIRTKQLQTNLWRWFTLPKSPPENYLMVNIPGFNLALIEDGTAKMQMKVIVGDIENQTPQMITEINRVTLNPTWTPTRNIIEKELIPEYQQDFLSLKRKNFQLVKGYWKNTETKEIDDPNLDLKKLLRSYRLVQAPGDNNALGYYRFNIPNNYSVYLHDTPIKSLFSRNERALSHGCIRLENADLLANYLLANENIMNKQKIKQVVKDGKTKNLPLNSPLPVYITYQTAWINSEGELRLSPDIYDLDQKKDHITQFRATVSNPVITLSQNNF